MKSLLKYNAHFQSMNKRFGPLTESSVEPHWRVWAAEIVHKKRLMQKLKTVDTFAHLKSMLAFSGLKNVHSKY